MRKQDYDIIVIGAGSGGLSIGLFMNQAGFKVLIISKTDKDIGGDCLNDGCVPSKAIIHVARLIHHAREANQFGLEVHGKVDIAKVTAYITSRQEVIREHENAQWLREQGIDVVLGEAKFTGKKEIQVNGNSYSAKKIVLATGSKPQKLKVEGVENVKYFDNESIFQLNELPENILIAGGGPIGIEMAQALSRLGSRITVVHHGNTILAHDDASVTDILLKRLQSEGVNFLLNSQVERFISANEGLVKTGNSGSAVQVKFDAVFVAIGRELSLASLCLSSAGIEVDKGKIIKDKFLRTTNKNVLVCGDVAGDLLFSHAAEFHARIILNNFFSPFKRKLNNDFMSWVTFTDPELATFGINESDLRKRKIRYQKLEQPMTDDDRAVTDNYQYGKLILLISKGSFFKKERILGGTMIAPNAGEMVQELILANTSKLPVKSVFNKVYSYPVASRVNQGLVTKHLEKSLTPAIKSLLKKAYQIFS